MIDIQLPCPGCGQPVALKVAAAPKIANLEHVSIAVLEHSPVVTCVCGLSSQMGVGVIRNIDLIMMPVQPEPDKNRIIVPGVTLN